MTVNGFGKLNSDTPVNDQSSNIAPDAWFQCFSSLVCLSRQFT